MRRKSFTGLESLLAAAALVILLGIMIASYMDWRVFREATDRTRHSREVLDATETLFSMVKDAETGQRGYILTGEKRYLEPYDAGLSAVPGLLQRLAIVKAEADPRQAARISELPALVDRKLFEMRAALDIHDKQGTAAAIDYIRTDRGKVAMDRIRQAVAEIAKDEYRLLVEGSERSEDHGQRTRLWITLGSAALFVMLLGAGVVIARAAARRERLIEEVQASHRRTAEVRDLLQTTLSSIGDGVLTTGANGKITFLNPVAEALTGHTQAQASGKPVEEVFRIVNESSRAPVESPVRRVLRDGVTAGLANHTILISRDGREIPIDDSGAPICHADGSIAGVVLVFRDIGGRKKAEEAALQLAAIVESSDDAIFAQGLDGKIINWNAGAERMFGYAAQEMVGRDLSIIVPEGAAADKTQLLDRILAGETVIHFEAVRRRKDGRLVEIAATICPMHDETGHIIGVSRINRDITERKRTLEALRESEERLRLSAEAAEIGMWSADPATGTLAWSDQMLRIFGVAPGAFDGSREQAARIWHPEDRERVAGMFTGALRGESDFEMEFRFLRPDGETRWMLSRGKRIRDANGKMTKLAGVAIDITSRKRLEEKMRQAQKLESLGVLAGGIAHDFNNLLVGIMGNAGIIAEELPPGSPLAGVIGAVLQASERAAHLTRQMLAYSGKGRFTVERLDLEVQVREILALIGASIPKGVRIALNFAGHLPPVEADPGQIQQLVMNLVINGAEAIGPEGGTVSISTSIHEIESAYVRDNLAGDGVSPGTHVLLEIHDTGCGMDSATQARIFDPFFTTKFTGRGLGLAAAQGIVRGHNGVLTVYSEPGKGSTFKVFLPAVPAPAKPAGDISPAGEYRGEGSVLVVDDEEIVRQTLEAGLARYGYTVLTAGGGEEAIRALSEMREGISVILLDMTMPGMSGEHTLKKLLEIAPGVPVIATSGYNEAEAIERFGAGLSGFIQKPYTPMQLAETIQRVLRG